MQMPLELLQNSPFQDYLIPGLILFTVLGIGSIAAAIVSIRRTPHYSLWIIVLGVLMAGWILVQILMLQTLHGLHYLYGGTGWALLLLGLIERKILAADPDQESDGKLKIEMLAPIRGRIELARHNSGNGRQPINIRLRQSR